MARVAPNVPAEADLLCEFCGYTLNGLPEDGNCPECGRPVADSVAPDRRRLTAWESDNRFWATTAAVIFRPTIFFRSFQTRGDPSAARQFARRHIAFAAVLFAFAAAVHFEWLMRFTYGIPLGNATIDGVWLGLLAGLYLSLTYITRLAARLTNWEATYRGLRLSVPVVARGLDYHAAHYLPVALIAAATVAYFRLIEPARYRSGHEYLYLYILSGEVVLSAAYLFHTYWIGMRNMMYANR